MTVYELLMYATDLSECKVSIWDFTTEKVVWDSEEYDGFDVAWEVDYQGFGYYEVQSYDIYLNKEEKVCFEINIESEEEDEDE